MWRMRYTILRNLKHLPSLLEIMHRITDRPEDYTEQEAYAVVRHITGLMQKAGHIRTVCYGKENLPTEGGYILYPNHQGKYDSYGIVSVHENPLSVVINREMSYFMLISEIIDILKGKRLDTEDPRQGLKIINQVAEEVTAGRRYIIFPEGIYTGGKHHALWDFKPGCFKAAVKAGAPIIPVALVDSYKVFNSWKILPVKTQVHFLQPLYPADYAGLNTSQISAIVKARIQNKLDALGCR